MLIRLLKCAICGNWYRLKTRNHCQCCGVFTITTNGKQHHIDINNGYEVVSATPQYHRIVVAALDTRN